MEEAYVIGIRLVLENGISAGLSTIGQDLAAFDRALAATTGNLQSLRELGAGMTAPIAAVRPDREPVPRQVVAPELTAEPSALRVISEPRTELPVGLATPPMPAEAMIADTEGRHPAARAAAPAAEDIQKVTPVISQAHRDVERSDREVTEAYARPSPPAPVARPIATTASTVPAVASAPSAPAPTQETVAHPRVRYADFAPASRGPAAATEQPELASWEGAAATSEPDPMGMARSAFGGGELPLAEIARSHVLAVTFQQGAARHLPSELSPGVPAAPAHGDAALSSVSPSRLSSTLTASPAAVAPVAPPTASGPVQGDVYLDGTRMGRWVADRLAREADRPPGGVTGFDSRLGVTWPGSMHGT